MQLASSHRTPTCHGKLTARTADPSADITPLESALDRHVYALYHLTPDEIEFVEGQNNNNYLL